MIRNIECEGALLKRYSVAPDDEVVSWKYCLENAPHTNIVAQNFFQPDQVDSGINSEMLGIGSGFPSAIARARR